jgi:peptidoglycan/LPS O-acetylase OafA/YrhL
MRVSQSGEAKPRVRLEFLDGLRGLASLYVVLFHACYELLKASMSLPGRAVARSLVYGHFAVDVFIVLSGFCLMMPVVRAGTGRLPSGFKEYLRRRARRILPPYYVAFALSVALAAGSVFVLHVGDRAQFGAWPVLSHLLLIHNFDFGWACAINGPLWSVATEWHIYFLFPLLLLPVWRAWGNIPVVLVGLGLGLAPFYLLPDGRNFWWAYPWFAGLFAMGMAAAATALHPARREAPAAHRFGSWQGALALFVVFAAVDFADIVGRNLWILDTLAGIWASSLILYCSRLSTLRASGDVSTTSRMLGMLESTACRKLGAMSYSLYLIHYPLVRASYRLFQKKIHSPELLMAAQLLLAVPVIVGLAYLFHLAFERRFMNQPDNSRVPLRTRAEQRAA